MMPSGDGIKLIDHIKQLSNTPIIMLTAMGEDIVNTGAFVVDTSAGVVEAVSERVDEETDMPGIQIFNTCTNLIAQLPVLPLDKRNPEDIDTHSEDHLYDALRYGIQSRPVPKNIFDLDPSTSPLEKFKPADAVFGY